MRGEMGIAQCAQTTVLFYSKCLSCCKFATANLAEFMAMSAGHITVAEKLDFSILHHPTYLRFATLRSIALDPSICCLVQGENISLSFADSVRPHSPQGAITIT